VHVNFTAARSKKKASLKIRARAVDVWVCKESAGVGGGCGEIVLRFGFGDKFTLARALEVKISRAQIEILTKYFKLA